MSKKVVGDLISLFASSLAIWGQIATAQAATPVPVPPSIEFDRFENSTFYFKALDQTQAPSPYKSDLKEARFIGSLRASANDTNPVPMFFFLAQEPGAELAVHAIRPPTATGMRQVAAFVQPGKIVDPKTKLTVMDSRAFVGHCLARIHGDVYTVFQKERVDRRSRLQSSVFIAQPGPEHLDEKLIESRLPNINETLRLVKIKVCREVEGRNRQMLRRPMDVRVHREPTPEDDDDQPEEGKTADAPQTQGAVEIGG